MNQRLASIQQVRRVLALVMCAIALSSLLQRYLGHPLSGGNVDFNDYFVAAQMVHENPRANLYEGATQDQPISRSPPVGSIRARDARADGVEDIELYLYPPLLADLLSPLAALKISHAAALWRCVNLTALVALALVVSRWLRIPWVSAEFGMIALAVAAAWPTHETIMLGQISLLIALLWAGGTLAFSTGWIPLSACLFALGTGIKVTPVLVVPLFLVWRQYRWLAWYGACLAALFLGMALLNGPANLVESFHVAQAMSRGVAASVAKSVQTLLAWLYYGRTYEVGQQPIVPVPATWFVLVSKVAALSVYAACLWPVWEERRSTTLPDRALVLSLFGLVVCLISPVSWRHGYTLALAPVTALWVHALNSPTSRLRLWLLCFASFTVGKLFFDLAARVRSPSLLSTICYSAWTLSCLALCLNVFYTRRRQGLACGC